MAGSLHGSNGTLRTTSCTCTHYSAGLTTASFANRQSVSKHVSNSWFHLMSTRPDMPSAISFQRYEQAQNLSRLACMPRQLTNEYSNFCSSASTIWGLLLCNYNHSSQSRRQTVMTECSHTHAATNGHNPAASVHICLFAQV